MNTSHPATAPSTRLRWLRTIVLAVVVALMASACGTGFLESQTEITGQTVPVEQVVHRDDKIVEGTTAAQAPRPDYAVDQRVEPDIALDGDVGFTPNEETVVVDNEDGSTTIEGTVEVPTAAGPIAIEDAEVIVAPDPVTGENKIIGGIGTLPFPTVGELEDAVINHLPQGIIGVALGRDLQHLGAHLVDDTEYMYFHFDGGLDIDLPIAGRPGFEAIPPKISVPTGKSATFVIDPTDPYFYIGGACPQNTDDDKKDDDKNDEDKRKRDEDEPKDALYTIPAADLPPGEDCGFGFSLNGNIPAPATAGGSTFSGHLVLDGIVPLYAGIELDGSTLLSFTEGVRGVGWGNVLTSLPLLPEKLNIQLPLGNASVEFQASPARVGMAVEGVLGSPEQITLPFDIPVKLPANNQMTFSANLGMLPSADGFVTFDPTSYIEIAGSANMGLGDFGQLIGLDLSDMATQDMLLRIDQTGIQITGVANAQIHPAIETDAMVAMEAFVSATDPAASYLTYDADIRVFGTDLAAATIDLSRRGLFVRGMVNAGGLGLEVGGQISDQGADISGRTALEINLDGLTKAADASAAALTDAIAEVNRLDAAIESTRETVRAERRDRDKGLADARRVVAAAQDELDVINRNISTNNRRIADLRRAHAAEKTRYNKLNLVQKTAQLVPHNAKLAGYDAEIVALEAANLTQKGLKPAAELALTGAQATLRGIEDALNALPVDTDPRIVSLFASRDTAVAALSALRAGVELIDVGGVIRGEIEVGVGIGGLTGSFSGEVCRSNGGDCTTLAGGRVSFFPTPELCVELPGLGEQCLPI